MDKISTRAVGRKLQNSDEKIHRAEKIKRYSTFMDRKTILLKQQFFTT